jgi:CheY-like chemotaxis protein
MDIQTPVMDGISATEKIREKEQATGCHTPIIAFTAAALVGDRERFLASGMDAYIAKPIDIKELHEILSKSLRKATNNGDDAQ